MLLEIVKILEESGETITVPTRADVRDRKRNARRTWERKHPSKSRRRKTKEDKAAKAARLRHDKLHLMVSRIAFAAEKANNEGIAFTKQPELVNFLAQEGVVGSHRCKGALASHYERTEIKDALDFGEDCGDIEVMLLPDGKRVLISKVSNPLSALNCHCREAAA